MVARITLFLALLAIGLALVGCSGGASSSALTELSAADNALSADQAPGAGNPTATDQAPAVGGDTAGVNKGAAVWIPDLPGFYTATAGAAYIDGVDYLFRLVTDNHGHYYWFMLLNNRSGQHKTIDYRNNTRRFTFRIDQNGAMRWNSNSMVPKLPAGSLVLPPYGSYLYSLPWNGADNHGHPIMGNVMATAIHRGKSHVVSMHGIAWLNGMIGF